MQVGIPKEVREHEKRVAATPETVKKLVGQGHEVVVESGAGIAAALIDAAFAEAGAKLVDKATAFGADLVLKVAPPTDDEVDLLKEGACLLGMLDPYRNQDLVKKLAARKVTSFALELLPRTTRAQDKDVLSSQANLAGYKAVVEAMAAYSRVMPMMMTAAGTVTPAKVFIIGAGVAGLQAIATARRMGAVVSATDVRPAAREEIASLGAKFVGFIPEDGATKGGYARPLTKEEQAEQAKMVAEHIKSQDIVVTTALIPGRPAPRIVSADMVESMKPGSVILDMAVESGGNVEGSKVGETVETENGVRILGIPNLPAHLAPATSTLYAKNLFNFAKLIIDDQQKLHVNKEDDLVVGALLTEGGAVVHANFQS
ncbi:MAG: Re/Si-specific NAD(P)(+) transhydrogenase subunit alpha [Pseudomonadota bacterium]